MNLARLNNHDENKSPTDLTSLSRLILTYISNTTAQNGEIKPVSTLNIFQEFGDLYTGDEICNCLANMLARDKTYTWRRPIFYHKHALDDDENIETALKKQWDYSISIDKKSYTKYTELLLCECGQAYLERLTSEFEFFSNRLQNNHKSIYSISDIKEIEYIINSVYNAVKNCYDNMILFRELYMNKKNISCCTKYMEAPIHPKTNNGNPQLHTERIIFSHIAYLEHCRTYHLSQITNPDEWHCFNNTFVKYIKNYLELFTIYIEPVSTKRKKIAEDLLYKIDSISKNEMKE